MGVQKPKEMNRIPMKQINKQVLQKIINEVLTWPTSKVHAMLSEGEENLDLPLIELAVVRCSYIGAYEGDIKRLEWLLNKMGIRDEVELGANADLAKLDSNTVLKALNVKQEKDGGEKKKRGRPKKNIEG